MSGWAMAAPRVAGSVDDILVGGEDAVGEPGLAQVASGFSSFGPRVPIACQPARSSRRGWRSSTQPPRQLGPDVMIPPQGSWLTGWHELSSHLDQLNPIAESPRVKAGRRAAVSPRPAGDEDGAEPSRGVDFFRHAPPSLPECFREVGFLKAELKPAHAADRIHGAAVQAQTPGLG